MSHITFALAVIGIAVLAAGCGQRPAGGLLGVTRNTTQGDDEVARALVEFEKGATSGSVGERVNTVYALDKYVRKHAVVVERLIEMLRSDKDPALRGAAARVLALTADGGDKELQEKAGAALITALDDQEQFADNLPSSSYPASVRYEAALGLQAFGELARPAVGKLGDLAAEANATDLEARIAAVEALGKLGPDAAEAVPKLVRVFAEPAIRHTPADRHLQLRLAVIATLGAMGEAAGEAVPELVKLLAPDRYERIYAAYALGKMGAAAKPAIPELLAQTDNENKDFSHFTSAMAELGDVMRPSIVADLESGEERRQVRALHTLMCMKEKGAFALPQVRKSMKSPVALVRENSIDAIMRTGPAGDAAIPELELALTDPLARVRYVAAQAIVERKPEHVTARESLIEMLDDEEMCPHAMTGLWSVGKHGTKAIPKLEELIKKDNPYLRVRAAVTLWMVHPESKIAPAVVREMLKHKDPEVRGSAAALVGRVGASAEPILDLLRAMLHDEDGSVQTWAKGSVEQIEAALKQSRAGESTKQGGTKGSGFILPFGNIVRA